MDLDLSEEHEAFREAFELADTHSITRRRSLW